MERPLNEHIAYLVQKIETLKSRLDGGPTVVEKARIQTDLAVAENALVYFRKAFELEKKISS